MRKLILVALLLAVLALACNSDPEAEARLWAAEVCDIKNDTAEALSGFIDSARPDMPEDDWRQSLADVVEALQGAADKLRLVKPPSQLAEEHMLFIDLHQAQLAEWEDRLTWHDLIDRMPTSTTAERLTKAYALQQSITAGDESEEARRLANDRARPAWTALNKWAPPQCLSAIDGR